MTNKLWVLSVATGLIVVCQQFNNAEACGKPRVTRYIPPKVQTGPCETSLGFGRRKRDVNPEEVDEKRIGFLKSMLEERANVTDEQGTKKLSTEVVEEVFEDFVNTHAIDSEYKLFLKLLRIYHVGDMKVLLKNIEENPDLAPASAKAAADVLCSFSDICTSA